MAATFGPDTPAFYVVAATVLVILLLKVVLRRPANLPPGPTGLPVIGSLHLLGASPHQNLAQLAKKYGPLMSLRIGQSQCIVASSSETAMEFLKNHDANFCNRPPMRVGESVLYGQDILCQNNTPLWRHRKKFFQVELTGAKRLAATRHVRAEEITHLIRTIPQNSVVDLRAHVGIMVTNIISRMVLNRRFSARIGERQSDEQLREIENIRETVVQITFCIGAVYPGDFVPALKWLPDFQGLDRRFKETHRRMDSLATKIISEHEARRKLAPMTEQEKDMLDLLLDEMEKSSQEDEPRVTMDSTKAITWNAFSGGTDTIAMTIEWTMSEVLRHPHVQNKAHAELDRVVGQNRQVQEADIPNLNYIQAIVKESMRLHPSSPLLAPHQSIKPCTAFGYDIPAKTSLFINVWAIGRDASIWTEPLEFNPDRFMDDDSNALMDSQNQHLERLPFGGGRRMCPGMALGLLTLQYCIANLLQAFHWSLTDEPDMSEGSGFVVGRAVPLCAIAEPRLSSEFYK